MKRKLEQIIHANRKSNCIRWAHIKSYWISENSEDHRGQRKLPGRYGIAKGPWKKRVEFRHGEMKVEKYQGRMNWYFGHLKRIRGDQAFKQAGQILK